MKQSGRPAWQQIKSAQQWPQLGHLGTRSYPPCIAHLLNAGRGAIDGKAQRLSVIAEKLEKLQFWEETVPRLYRGTTINQLPFPEIARAVLKYSDADEIPGVMFIGATGSGKTRTAYLLEQEWLRENLQSWRFRVLEGSQIADAANARSRSGGVEAWIEEMLEDVESLMIDDIGHGNFSNSYAETLRRLVERCTSSGIALVVTCQYDGRALLRQWSRDDPGKAETAKAIVRRLAEFCRPVHMERKRS